MSDYGPMTIAEWREVFKSLPEPTLEALADYLAWRRGESTGAEYEARRRRGRSAASGAGK